MEVQGRRLVLSMNHANEADKDAKKIKFSDYSAADQQFGKEQNGDGCSVTELYAKEFSRLMIEDIKQGAVAKTDREVGIVDKTEEYGGTSFDMSGDPQMEKLLNVRYTSFVREAAVLVQLIIPSIKDHSPYQENQSALEVVKILSFAPQGNMLGHLHMTNKSLCEKHIKGFGALLKSGYKMEEQCLLKQEEVGAKLLNLLTKPGNRHTKFCIRSTSIGREAAALVAEPILSSIKHELTEVELSDFVSGRDDDEALEVMGILSSALEGCDLQYLNLSNNAVLGEKGIRAFGPLLKSQINLEELYLLNEGISEEAAESLRELIPTTNKLRVLQFHDNQTYDLGAMFISEIVSKCPLLEDFRCSNSRVCVKGGMLLAQSLRNCCHIKKLDLRGNPFFTDGGLALSSAVSVFSGLSEIYLSSMELNNEASFYLAKCLKKSGSSLKVLDLARNSIGDAAAAALAECIASKRSLTKLNLASNFLENKGAALIALALDEGTHDQLCEVDLSHNFIGLDGAITLAQAVLGKPRLKVLNITSNEICPDDWKSKVEVLFQDLPSILVPLDNKSAQE